MDPGDGRQGKPPSLEQLNRSSRPARARLRTNLDFREHDEREDLDGWRVAVDPVIRYVLDSRTVLEVGPYFEAIEAREDHRGSRLAGLNAGVSRVFKNEISVSISASVQLQDYRTENPIFGTRRKDKAAKLSGRVLHRSLQFGGFTPYVGYSYEENRSNISLYDYRNHGVIMGLSREF